LFFGKNSTGGVVSFTSRDPGDEIEGALGGGYEFEAEAKYASALLSGPLSDTVGARIFARYSSQEGYYNIVGVDSPTDTSDAAAILGPAAFLFGNNPALPSSASNAPESKDLFLRGTLTFEPTDAFDARAKLTYSDRKFDSYSQFWQRSFCPLGSPNFLGIPLSVLSPGVDIDDCKFDDDVVTGDRTAAQLDGFSFGNPDADGSRNPKIFLGSLEMNYDFGNGLTGTSISGLYTVDDMSFQDQSNTPTAYLPTGEHTEIEQFTQEVRLTSDWDTPINFLLGGFYETRETKNRNEIPGIGRSGAHEQDQTAYSFFGELAWDITEQVEISGGVRYTDEEKDVVSMAGGVNVPFIIPGGDEKKSDNLIPEFTVSYRPTDNLMVYGSYKEGFKSGGFDAGALNAAAQAVADIRYDDENVDGFEVGVKAVFLDQTLQVNATAYSYNYKNLQVTSFDAVAVVVTTVNATGADINGAELDFTWQPANVDGLTIRGAAALLDAKYRDFISTCWTGQSPAAGCDVDVVPGGAFEGLDLSGQEIQRAPEFSSMLGFSYRRPIMNDRFQLGIGGDWSYSDSYDVMQQRKEGTRQPSYHKLNASIRVSDINDSWTLALIGRNLNDEVLRTVGQNVPLSGAGTGTVGAIPSDSLNLYAERGREIILQLTFRPGAFGG
jgi:iron complex outermembrane receptor protein